MNANIVYHRDAPLNDLGGGVSRRVLAHTDGLMIVEVHFEAGGVGATHTHPHRQNTYVLSKVIDFEKKSASEGGGFIMGKNILTLFDALTEPYTDSLDFNRLPIPFACVATNIIDNSEYDFHSGILSQAMRASMSIPGVFSPVRKGDMVLVDGGLRNNFPADIAREMGADYIIGVSVQGAPKTAADLGTMGSIIGQIVDVNCKNKYDDNLAMTDIVIKVNTSGYGAASFTTEAIDTLIRRGEEAAMKHWGELMMLRDKLGVSQRAVPRISTVRVPLPVSHRYKIGELVFENMTKNDQAFICDKFHLHVQSIFLFVHLLVVKKRHPPKGTDFVIEQRKTLFVLPFFECILQRVGLQKLIHFPKNRKCLFFVVAPDVLDKIHLGAICGFKPHGFAFVPFEPCWNDTPLFLAGMQSVEVAFHPLHNLLLRPFDGTFNATISLTTTNPLSHFFPFLV